MYENVCGVYRIINNINGKCYVGSSTNVGKRWRQHRTRLNTQVHENGYLQRSWNCHGASSFKFEILAIVDDPTTVHLVEQEWMEELSAVTEGYNLKPFALGAVGYKHTDEARAKLSAALKGRTITPEWRAKLSAAKMGKKMPERSAETRAKISAVHKGKPKSEEAKAKISATLVGKMKGVPKSEATRQRMKEAWVKRRAEKSIS